MATVAADLADRDAADRIVATHADYPLRRFDKTLDVNFRSPFQVLQGSIPLLRPGAGLGA